MPLTFLGNHDVTRVASQIGDPRHRSHAAALLGFLPGVPSIYYGDEFGLEAVKEQRPGGDDAVRPELPGERWLFAGERPDVEATYRQVLGLRRRNAWLVDAVVSTSHVAGTHLVVHAEGRHDPARRLTLVLNLADGPFAVPGSGEVLEASSPVVAAEVAPHAWAVLAG